MSARGHKVIIIVVIIDTFYTGIGFLIGIALHCIVLSTFTLVFFLPVKHTLHK